MSATLGRQAGRQGMSRVTAVDWTAMLAELEAEKVTAVAAIDEKIAAVRVLAGQNGHAPSAPAPRKKTPALRPSFGRAEADWIQKARVMFERGEPVQDIAKACGKTDAGVRYQAKVKGWQRGAAKKTPTGAELAGNVRCPSCESMTKYDPCEHCHKKVRR